MRRARQGETKCGGSSKGLNGARRVASATQTHARQAQTKRGLWDASQSPLDANAKLGAVCHLVLQDHASMRASSMMRVRGKTTSYCPASLLVSPGNCAVLLICACNIGAVLLISNFICIIFCGPGKLGIIWAVSDPSCPVVKPVGRVLPRTRVGCGVWSVDCGRV